VTNCSFHCLFEVSKIRKELLAFYKNIKVQTGTTKEILSELNASLNVFFYQHFFSFVINTIFLLLSTVL